MKQVSLILNILLTAGIIYFGCTSREVNEKNTSGYNSIPCNDSFTGVPKTEFIQAVARYRTTHWDIMNAEMIKLHKNDTNYSKMDTADSRSVWISLSALKNFLCYIEMYSDSIKENRSSLGLRLYYGVNPGRDTANSSVNFSGLLGKQSIYIVPTIGTGENVIDFDPYTSFMHRKNGDSSIAYIETMLAEPGNFGPLPMLRIVDSLKTCPPNCPAYELNPLRSIDRIYPGKVLY